MVVAVQVKGERRRGTKKERGGRNKCTFCTINFWTKIQCHCIIINSMWCVVLRFVQNLVTIKATEKGYRAIHQTDNKCQVKKSRYANMELQNVMVHNPG